MHPANSAILNQATSAQLLLSMRARTSSVDAESYMAWARAFCRSTGNRWLAARLHKLAFRIIDLHAVMTRRNRVQLANKA